MNKTKLSDISTYPSQSRYDNNTFIDPLHKWQIPNQTTIINNYINSIDIPKQIECLHDKCTSCNGTGITKLGTMCFHAISCPCRKCTPWC